MNRSENKAKKKKIQACTGAGPLTTVVLVQCSINWGNINQLANKPTHVYFFCVYYTHVMVTVQLSVLKRDIRYKRKVKNLNYCLTWPLFSDQNSYSVGQRVYKSALQFYSLWVWLPQWMGSSFLAISEAEGDWLCPDDKWGNPQPKEPYGKGKRKV